MKRSTALSRIAVLLIALACLCGFAPDSGAAPVGEKAIKQAVKKHVEDNAPWPKDRVRVEFFGSMPEVSLPEGPANVQVRSRAGEHYIGRTSFTVRFSKGDTVVREEAVRVRIEVLTDVVVTTRGIMRDAIIDADDVTVTSKWMDTATTGILTDSADVLGKKAVARLNAAGAAATADATVRERLLNEGIVAAGGSPADFGTFLTREAERWRPLLRRLDIQLN